MNGLGMQELRVGQERLAWNRKWIPRAQVVRLGWGGIAEDPDSDFGRRLTPNAITLDSLDEQPLVALEGDAGLGKSTAIRQHVEQRGHPNVIYVRAIDLVGPDDLSRAIASAVSTGGRLQVVYLDGIDESRWADQSQRLLRFVEPQRTHLRLVCRANAWPRVLETDLAGLAVQFFELLPLTRPEIATAAKAYSVDLEKFLQALHGKDLAPLTQRPITLLELLDTFRSRGELPQSRTVLFRNACRRHCEEHNEAQIELERSGAIIGLDQRLRAIQRSAAYSVLCDRPYFVRGAPPSSREQHLLLSDLAGSELIGASRCTLSERDMRVALEKCELISPAPGGTAAFGHRSFAEHLTAEYLYDTAIPFEQVRVLLCHERAPDRVALQLVGVASELCALDPAFARWIARNDPRVLLAADLTDLRDEDREAVVTAIGQPSVASRRPICVSTGNAFAESFAAHRAATPHLLGFFSKRGEPHLCHRARTRLKAHGPGRVTGRACS